MFWEDVISRTVSCMLCTLLFGKHKWKPKGKAINHSLHDLNERSESDQELERGTSGLVSHPTIQR